MTHLTRISGLTRPGCNADVYSFELCIYLQLVQLIYKPPIQIDIGNQSSIVLTNIELPDIGSVNRSDTDIIELYPPVCNYIF